jgi:hypothetical protein
LAEVLRAADAACYSAKYGGGNRVHLQRFSPDPADVAHAMTRRATRPAHAELNGYLQL